MQISRPHVYINYLPFMTQKKIPPSIVPNDLVREETPSNGHDIYDTDTSAFPHQQTTNAFVPNKTKRKENALVQEKRNMLFSYRRSR